MNPLFAIGLPTGGEWFYIMLVVLLLFGPKKLPDLARGLGRSIGEFKRAKQEFEQEIHNATSTPPDVNVTKPASPELEAPKKL